MTRDTLKIDADLVQAAIVAAIRDQVLGQLRRRGVVLGLSGGVDSSVVAALSVKALGPSRVLGLLMPEEDSDPDSLRLGRMLGELLGIDTILEDIRPILKAAGCYQRRDDSIRKVFPDYGDNHRCKLVVPGLLDGSSYTVSSLVVESPSGEQRRSRPSLEAYLGIVAASNMKQRVRKMVEYYHADRLNYAVAGTPNRLEYDQGFFVKNGDGAADLKPIAHLYKTQVFQLAEHLGVPAEVRQRPPTTDTYSLAQTQEEFFFALPLETLDLCLYALNQKISPEVAATVIGLTPEQIQRIYKNITAKRRATAYLHRGPLLAEPVFER